jgi:hypothetical protein
LRVEPLLRAVVFLRAGAALRAVAFLAVLFLAVLLRAGAALRAVLFFAVLLRAVDLRAVLFLAVLFFAVLLRAVDFRAVVLRAAGDRFAVDFFFVAAFLAEDFFAAALFGAAFLAVAFFAVDFFADDFLRDEELRVDPERELEREDRAAAGTARAISSLDASPIDEPPHVFSTALAVGSLHEPAFDASGVLPVPLQSSWVINDLLIRIARARFPTTLLSNVQRGRHRFRRTLLKRKT